MSNANAELDVEPFVRALPHYRPVLMDLAGKPHAGMRPHEEGDGGWLRPGDVIVLIERLTAFTENSP